MRLPAKVEYAVKALYELAVVCSGKGGQGGLEPLSVEVIAERQSIPRKFLVQILVRLGQAGLVKSVRGLGGGYLLARHPSQITLQEIFSAVDNSIIGVDGGSLTNASVLPSDYALRKIWGEVNSQIVSTLSLNLEQFLSLLPEPPISYDI